ncbi:hypothetical protein LOD99_6266 [Oopsacas minuta]|uniref:Uncharacterized protein n=1 Tax=Oopsacas minuta TaxID=111878 RepID=A0AAV7JNS5_9METZ|nr:hypothetical protein LOD99_6266 [Oopsacas minuta]
MIQDTDLDIQRPAKGINITRSRKLKGIQNDSFRAQCKEKHVSGEYSPTQYVDVIASSIHPDTNPINLLGDCPDESSSMKSLKMIFRLIVVCAYFREQQQSYFFLVGMHNVVRNAVHPWNNVQYAGAI